MIQFAIGVHAFWASHTTLLLGHLVALAGLVGVWGAISRKDQPTQQVRSFHVQPAGSHLELAA